jgi:two-component sensor histidine kinase
MVDSPEGVLPRLVDIAIEMCGAVSGGLSLYEPDPAPGVFRWHHLRGELEKFNGATTPRDFSPCGVTLDMKAPVLVERPERMYTWLAEANVSLPECLLVPLYIGGVDPLGTIWIVSESEGHFHASHAEVLLDLAAFTGIAVRMARNEKQLKAALDQQETLTREMSHRVQNLFAITDALIRGSSRTATTPKELAESLSGRLHALSAAHGLVRRSFDGSGTDKEATDLAGLIKAVLKPYENLSLSRTEGPKVPLTPKSINALALVFHELATNSAKYGSLSCATGALSVTWQERDGQLAITWTECGGPPIEHPPHRSGFGTALSQRTIASGMGGSISCDWNPDGVVVRISVALAEL